MKFLKVLFISLSLFVTSVKAQNNADSLTYYLNDYFTKKELPGFSVVILNKDGAVYQHSSGHADIQNQIPYTVNTIQNIGSVSKTVVAVALMKAIELGYFTLETDVNDILPFKIVNPHQPGSVIRVKHLTNHTSGIIDNKAIYPRSVRFKSMPGLNADLAKFMRENRYTSDLADTTLDSFLKSYLSPVGTLYSKLNFLDSKPGESSSYSNIGSALAAYLIEVKCGMSFAKFSEKYILKPLKMRNTSWFLSGHNIGQHAIPYFNRKIRFPFYSLTTYPDGELRTSATELSKYVLEMMHSVTGHSRILQQTSVKTMFKPAFTAESKPEGISLASRNKGILWNIYNDGYIGHDGDDPGVISQILFNDHIGIVFIANMYIENRSDLLVILKKYGEKLVSESTITHRK